VVTAPIDAWTLAAALGLWILPALWKTPETGVSHNALEISLENARFPQAPQAFPSVFEEVKTSEHRPVRRRQLAPDHP
jgi:hypothetical protein